MSPVRRSIRRTPYPQPMCQRLHEEVILLIHNALQSIRVSLPRGHDAIVLPLSQALVQMGGVPATTPQLMLISALESFSLLWGGHSRTAEPTG